MNIIHKTVLITGFILVPLLGLTQAQNNSIFSRFGIGDLYPQTFASASGIGFAASGYYSNAQTNTLNPASYAFLKKTAFDLGLTAKYYGVETDQSIYRNWTGSFDYLSLAFPLYNSINRALDPVERDYNIGMAIALQQYSRVGYNLTTTETIVDVGQIERNYTGFGGTNKFLWGTAFAYKDLSIGVNLSYLFGKISYQKNILYADYPNPYNNAFSTFYNLRGFTFDAGAMYRFVLNKDKIDETAGVFPKEITFGVHYTNAINGTTNATVSNINFITSDAGTQVDSIDTAEDVEGAFKIPSNIGLGLSYKNGNKWGASVAYQASPWSQYSNDAEPITLADVQSFNAGFYYIPKYNSITNFLARINYKAGFFYKTEPALFNNEQVQNIGVTFGLGMPFVYQRKSSIADLSIALAQRNAADIIVENYLELRFGFSFNDDEWFLKRKYN